jgi:glutathione-regulated potassium-efflux system ancillary protein KefC
MVADDRRCALFHAPGALVAGLAGASSTAIALQAIGERNLMPTPAARRASLFQDVAAIPMLALLPLLAPPASI